MQLIEGGRLVRSWVSVFTVIYSLLCAVSGTAYSLPLQTSVAVVSQEPFHLEVLAGVLHVTSPLVSSVTAYVHERNLDGGRLSFGFSEWFATHHHLQGLLQPLSAMQKMEAVDVLLLISPEYDSPGNLKQLLKYARPRVSTLLFVHNADAVRLPSLHAVLRSRFKTKTIRGKKVSAGSRNYLVALAPHVAEAVTRRMNVNVSWILPVHPAVPVIDTPVCQSMQALDSTQRSAWANPQHDQRKLQHVSAQSLCGNRGTDAIKIDVNSALMCNKSVDIGSQMDSKGGVPARRGFVVQGRADAGRRNFNDIWNALEEAQGSFGGNVTQLDLLVLASGSKKPTIPPFRVSHLVKMQRNAPYKRFYAQMSSAAALLPALGSEAYLRCTPQPYERTATCGTKLTSSILASLATNTPIVAVPEFLATHKFLDPEATWAPRPGDSLGEALEWIASSDTGSRERKAGCVGVLRERLNSRSQRLLLEMFQAMDP